MIIPSPAEQLASRKRLNALFRPHLGSQLEPQPVPVRSNPKPAPMPFRKMPFIIDPWAPRCNWPRSPEELARAANIEATRTIKVIILIVARYFNVNAAEIYNPTRLQHIVRARQIAMYLARELTRKSLPEIGRRFGGRDHTTVLHALRRMDELVKSHTETRDAVEELRRLITDRDHAADPVTEGRE